jgi:putative sigma-54 modulation protein
MKMITQTPGFTATRKLQKFVQDNVSKLEQISERIIESRVCLKLDKSDKKANKVCEIRLVIPGNDLFASRQCNSFEEAVLQSTEAIRHQVERLKTVRIKKNRNSVTPLESEEGAM